MPLDGPEVPAPSAVTVEVTAWLGADGGVLPVVAVVAPQPESAPSAIARIERDGHDASMLVRCLTAPSRSIFLASVCVGVVPAPERTKSTARYSAACSPVAARGRVFAVAPSGSKG